MDTDFWPGWRWEGVLRGIEQLTTVRGEAELIGGSSDPTDWRGVYRPDFW